MRRGLRRWQVLRSMFTRHHVRLKMENLTAQALSVALGGNPEFLSVCGAKRLSFLGEPIPAHII